MYKAYPFEELIASGRSTVDDVIEDRPVTIHWDQAAQSAYATTGAANEVRPTVIA